MKLLLAAFLLISISALSQGTERPLYDPILGDEAYIWQYTDIEGDPFMADTWMDGTVIGTDGYQFNNVKLKFDVYNNIFLFNRNDSAFQITTPISEVRLIGLGGKEMIFKNGFKLNGVKAEKFVQVLTQGKLTLLKNWSKTLDEYKEYSSANKFKRFSSATQFYLQKNDTPEKVNISLKELKNQLADKWLKVEKYMSANNLSGKNENGWAAAISYYNSL